MAADYLMAVRYSSSLIGKYLRVCLWPKTDRHIFLKTEQAVAEVRTLCKSEAVVAIQRVLPPGVPANQSLHANDLAAHFEVGGLAAAS
jgi:hypothetical protein